ncbi:hypothetical protein Ahy_B10g104967 [Arachis hypogaea]|uniref:Uncharacterized protein n=1 Tax=Arachis hypogaea TaxID=3818 RepID=A0A444X768_ARAHY|nr:hypothetical protein Ahy_B10g104967 [Arachis hypogaea]
MLNEANNYMKEMLSKSFSPYSVVIHGLVRYFCNVVDDGVRSRDILEQVLKIEIKGHTRIVDVGIGLENYLIRKYEPIQEHLNTLGGLQLNKGNFRIMRGRHLDVLGQAVFSKGTPTCNMRSKHFGKATRCCKGQCGSRQIFLSS